MILFPLRESEQPVGFTSARNGRHHMAQWINFSRSSSSLSFFITIIISVIIIRITEIFIYIKSSFSIPGDIMNSHPATYYHYEPLLHYDIKQARYDYHHHCHHHHHQRHRHCHRHRHSHPYDQASFFSHLVSSTVLHSTTFTSP